MKPPYMPNLRPVQRKDLIDFRCVRCGVCCKHIRQCVMLSSYDVFRLAKHFANAAGSNDAISHVCENYTDTVMLTERYPILTLRTKGEDDACIFLDGNRCNVYAARPRICRLYPLAAEPAFGDTMFQYHLCTDQPHHFCGGRMRVKEWVRNNFSAEEQAAVLQELKHTVAIHRALDTKSKEELPHLLAVTLFQLYFNYDLAASFITQYERNCSWLMSFLKAQPHGESTRAEVDGV